MDPRNPGNCLQTACLLGLLAAPAIAQTTHVVGPGGHPTLAAAIGVAAPGDFVVVQPGVYTLLNLTKGLTIRGATPGTVTIIPAVLFMWFDVPIGQRAHLVDLDLDNALFVLGGTVTFDRCNHTSGGDLLVVRNSTIHLQDCTLRIVPSFVGTPNGTLTAHDSIITAIDSTIAGGTGTTAVATSGVILTNSTFHASNCTISGGGPWPVVDGLVADASSTVWLSDSTVTSDPATCPIAAPNASGHMARTSLRPPCGALPTGPLLGVGRASPITRGSTFTLTFTSDPNETIGVVANLDLGVVQAPLFGQPGLLAPGYWPAALVSANGSGLASVSWSVPAGAALVDRTVWVQGYAGLVAPLQVSPVAGGVIR